MKFDDSIVTINNKTYIPLREMAEQMNMQIEWSEEEQKVMLSEKPDMIEAENIFSELFGFELTSTAKILEYDYKIEDQEQYFVSKISFEKKDLEQIKNGCSKFSIAPDSLQTVRRGTIPLSIYANKYEWWDLLELTDETEVYRGCKTGVYKKTVSIWMFIAKESNNEYYLYVIYG